MIEFVEVPIGTGGVLSCARCGERADAQPHPAEEVLAAIASLSARDVVLTGFEPFRHPALPALIGAAVEAGAQRIMLRTDAGALATAGNAAGCVAAGVRALEVVLLADGERQDALCGRPGLAAAAESGVTAFRQAAEEVGIEVAIFGVVPLCRHNVADLPATVAAFARMGAVAVRVEAASLRPTPEHRAAIDAAVHTGAVNRVAVSVAGWAGDLPALVDRIPYVLVGGPA